MTAPYVPATKQLVVEVFVRRLDQAIDFYRDLGFQLVSRKNGFATLAWEKHELFLDERPAFEPPPSPQANVRVMVRDVDAWWRRAVGMGARVVAPIADPDGFGVRFGTRIEPR